MWHSCVSKLDARDLLNPCGLISISSVENGVFVVVFVNKC